MPSCSFLALSIEVAPEGVREFHFVRSYFPADGYISADLRFLHFSAPL